MEQLRVPNVRVQSFQTYSSISVCAKERELAGSWPAQGALWPTGFKVHVYWASFKRTALTQARRLRVNKDFRSSSLVL